jgi:hypothetical protein
MGNDPGNGVDPTGGFFDPGPLAQLACPGSGGGSFLKVLNTISAIGSVASKGMGLGGSITSNMGNNNQSLNQSASSGSSGSNAGNSSVNDLGDEQGNSDCPDCPPGYGPNPKPGKNQKPYFLDIDDAAIHWSKTWGKTSGGKNGKAIERSSLIYGIPASNGTILYQYTFAVRFADDNVAKGSSPGPRDYINHQKLPPNATQYGQIHLHWWGSTGKSYGTPSDNRTFSSLPGGDTDLMKKFSSYTYYVLGSEGTLWASYASDMPYVRFPDGYYTFDSRAGTQDSVEASKKLSFYHNDTKSLNPCKCYEQ